MAEVKLISGKKITPEQSPSFLPQTAAQIATGIAGAPGNLISGVNQLISSLGSSLTGVPAESFKQTQPQIPTTQNIREVGEQFLGKGYLQPQGFIQEALDLTAQNLPLTFLLPGGSLAAKTISDLGSSAAMVGAKKAGLADPLSQFVSGALGAKGASKALSKLTGGAPLSTLSTLAKDAQVKLEEDAIRLGTPLSAKADKYTSQLLKLEDKITDSTALKSADKKELKDKVSLLFNDIQNDKVNAAKLLERKREINKVWPQYAGRENQAPRQFLDQIQKTIFEQADEIAKESSEGKKWYKAWKASDDITKALNYQSAISNLLEDVPYLGSKLKSGLAKSIVGLLTGGYAGGSFGAAGLGGLAGLGGSKLLEKGEQIYGFLSQSPSTRNLLQKAIEQSSKRQIPQLAKTFTQLNSAAEKYEKKHPVSQAEEKSKIKLISGKKIA